MEKIWFRHIRSQSTSAVRLRGARYFKTFVISLLMAGSLGAEDMGSTQSVNVDVEVSVEGDNLAAAKVMAEKQAFEKALVQVWPEGEAREKAVKSPKQFISSFKVLEEHLEGGVLKQKLMVEVQMPSDKTPVPEASASPIPLQTYTFEVAWMPDEIKFNAVDFLKYVKENSQAKVQSFRMGRGNLVLSLSSTKSIEEMQAQLAQFVGKRGSVKLLVQNQNLPANQLASPVSAPSPDASAPMPSLTSGELNPAEAKEPVAQPTATPVSVSPTPSPMISGVPTPAAEASPAVVQPSAATVQTSPSLPSASPSLTPMPIPSP